MGWFMRKRAYDLLVGFSMLDQDYANGSMLIDDVYDYSWLDKYEKSEISEQLGWRQNELS